MHGYEANFKRGIDLVLAVTALVALTPVMLIVGFLIWLNDGGPPLFKQMRVGKGGTPYRLMKFRSMPVNSGDMPSTKALHFRITRVGRIIRRTNIDELPQLFNILRGDMSLVGPRPALPSQVALIEMRRQNGAYGCKPGLTGLAQVNSYDGMPETEKARWDGEYAVQVSLSGDCLIMLRTIGYLLRRPPVY